jgi:hypothetical protein
MVPVIKSRQLTLYREIIAVCSEIHIKHTNTLCGQNVELLNVKPGGTYSDHNLKLHVLSSNYSLHSSAVLDTKQKSDAASTFF